MKHEQLFKMLMIFSMVSFVHNARAQVKSSSFNFTLKLLLSSKTPSVTIPQAAAAFSNTIFLDARELKEYQVSHLKNALFVGSKTFSLDRVKHIQKNQPLVVYCSIGKRSEDVTLQLIKAGFTNVKNLYGGIFEWVNQGHAVYNNQNNITDSVHAYGQFWGNYLEKGIKVYD
ncbi:MAG: rhodanese-like domain-containing protein [Chitinophagaceae bacterium]|jgi:rhodanese-related sulfurtransferase|nr:rhodanese-like domain-containing protein [Chitinophagaceae bacterium]